MFLESLVICLYAFSGFLLFLALFKLRAIFRLSWTLPFRCLNLIILVFFSGIFLISASQLSSYTSFETKKPLARVQAFFISDAHYQIVLSPASQESIDYNFEIYGDMWQIDMRLLTWQPLVHLLGLDTLYRIERVSGRYKSIEDEHTQARSLYSLNEEIYGVEVWRFLLENFQGTLVRSYFGAGVYAPLSDQALYGIYLSETGIELRPLNEVANAALNKW